MLFYNPETHQLVFVYLYTTLDKIYIKKKERSQAPTTKQRIFMHLIELINNYFFLKRV